MQLYFQVLSPIPELEAVPGQHLSVNTSNVRWPVAVMRMHGPWALSVIGGRQRRRVKCLTRQCPSCPLRSSCPEEVGGPGRHLRLIRGSGG